MVGAEDVFVWVFVVAGGGEELPLLCLRGVVGIEEDDGAGCVFGGGGEGEAF